MNEKHVLECKNISFMTAISNGSWFSKIYKPPSVFQILKNVSFTAISGEVHGIVGVADSGKTTLLEALTSGAGGDIGGIAMLDKFMLTRRRFNKFCSHINYRNQYPSSLTVRSLLYYHARLCLSSSHTTLEIDHRISELSAMFDVIGYAHDKLEDLSISAKRRVMTVLELLKDPILTIIDDPTADLSPLSAYQLVYALHFYAAKFNRIIIITLRNVRSDLSHLLGAVTFLFYGEVAYSGPMRLLPTHFKKAGFECPSDENPAAYYLALLTIDKESMEKVMETQEKATKLVAFRAENETPTEVSGSTATGTGVLLDSGRKGPTSSTVFSILFRRMLSIISSTPSTSLAGLIALPVVAAVSSFLRNSCSSTNLPSSLFFWKLVTFLFLLLQIIVIFPNYSKTRLLSFRESNLYCQTSSLITFFLLFLIYSTLQSALFVGIASWSFNFTGMFQITLTLLLLSIFSFSIFSICARYLKDCSNVLFFQSAILLAFFVTGNGVTRTTASSSMLYYGGVANPFSYSNFLLSKIITNSTESEECTYPIYMCKLSMNLHSDLYPPWYTPSDTLTNFLILSCLSTTFLVVSLLIHYTEPSVQLQKHMKAS
ncbi:CRE-ABCH-1 protein [Caenorhabditis remanei]|uniref:CRE-ABCH-1 protein n=1 Tax=Caenorhabditis remanei TaxID=31234 RepID=E3LR24_CAERE|nr:CRE-ABCH-1 protein [Caenorhabditis remanei]